MNNSILFTIGYTKRSASNFFSSIKNANIKLLIDIRLNNTSQLAGYTKKDDLAFFLEEICGCNYKHHPEFAPTKEILDAYHAKEISWSEYEIQFNNILHIRKPIAVLGIELLDHACLLCAEPTPVKCHRRLVAEYFAQLVPNLVIQHL